ncbi:MAG: InlB B-repeat-containing protein [Clostridiales bacterium]|jgi:uncharacterized repeat protein (TIGR02543 family)|nr:InlB B-repeat-containing protein [Clostridiales bacterium]
MREKVKFADKRKVALILAAAFLSLMAAGAYFVGEKSPFGGGVSYAAEVYTVSFDSNGGSPVEPVSVGAGTSILLPTIYRPGYIFEGWFAAPDLSGTAEDWFFIPDKSVTLYAKFVNSYAVGLYIGGALTATIVVPIGESADLPLVSGDSIIEGWFTDPACLGLAVRLPYKPSKDIRLYAKLAQKSTVTFVDPLDGTFYMNVSAESAFMLPKLQKDGYIFDGWYTDAGFANKALWNYTAANDITLYAKWYQRCTITFKDGDVAVDSIATTVGTSILLSNVLSGNSDFEGWFSSQSFEGVPAYGLDFYIAWGDAVFYAKRTAPLYIVALDFMNGSPISSQSVRAGGSIELPTPVRTGYAFDGWFTGQDGGGSKINSPYTPTGSITLYAKWTELYTVTFDSTGGSGVASQNVRAGSSIAKPDNPVLASYRFDGWYESSSYSGSEVTFPYTPTGDITLYAKWTFYYTVIFDKNGGAGDIPNQTVYAGQSASLPTHPTKTSSLFLGWVESTSDAYPILFPWTPTGTASQKTLYARWVTETGFTATDTDYYSNIMANSIFNKNIRVVDIAMLGAHDAFTHNIASGNQWNPVDPNFLQYGSSFGAFEGTVKSVTARLSKAQSLGASDLAKNGVRLYDVRLVHSNGVWYTEHGLISSTFESYLRDALQFMYDHPRELIVFDIQRVYTNGSSLQALYNFIDSVKHEAGGRSLFDYVPYNASTKPLGSLTYGDAVTDKAGAVVLMADSEDGEDGFDNIINNSKVYHRNGGNVIAPWANTDDINTLMTYIDTQYNSDFSSHSNRLRINQAQRTPQFSYSNPASLIALLSGETLLQKGKASNDVLITQPNLINGNWFNVLPVMWVDNVGETAFHAAVMPVVHKSNITKSKNA